MPGIKQYLKDLLTKKGWYNDFKYSFIFRAYQRLFKPYLAKQHQVEISFYKSFLSTCDLIFDIGANDGHKTEAFLTICKKVVCCEPDDHNAAILRSRFRNKTKRVVIEQLAISDRIGQETFYIHHTGSALNTLNPRWKETLEADQGNKWNEIISFSQEEKTIQATTLDELIHKYGVPAFIKIDVEGSEKKVLAGLNQKISFLSFECLLPDFRDELQDCLAKVQLLDEKALFNIAAEEKLLFPDFVSLPVLQDWVKSAGIHHFEIVVEMKN